MSKTIVGREQELSQLAAVFEAARHGKGGIVFLAGEAGVGKTRLAHDALKDSRLAVFAGRTIEEATPPYGPITAVLRECLRADPKLTAACGNLASYLALLLPELGSAPPEVDREVLVEAVTAVLEKLAEKTPCALFLDDLQWADHATLEFLPALADRLQNLSLIILGTYRSDEIPRDHRIRWVRNELRRSRRLHEIPVKALNEEASAQVIEHLLGKKPAASLVGLLCQKTQGLPLFLEELTTVLKASDLIRSGEDGEELTGGDSVPIPESVRDTVLLRLDALSAQARNQLEVAAVAGMEFVFDMVIEISGERAGLDELLERNLIAEIARGRGAFRHALTREAIRNEIMWSRRRDLNRKIAQYMESKSTPPEIVAEHWLAAGELSSARKALLASAQRSCQVHAYRDAARAGNRALEIWPDGEDEALRLDTLEELAHCAQVSGQLSDAARALREFVGSATIQANRGRFAKGQRSLATIYGLQGAWEQSLSARSAAAEAFERNDQIDEASVEWLAAATRNTGMMHLNEAIQLARKAAHLAERTKRWDVQARAMALEGNVLSMQGKAEEGCDTVRAALSLALEHNLSEAASEVYRRLGSALDYASDYVGSSEAYSTAYDYCRSQGADVQAQLCLGCMSWVLFRTGDWKRCIEVAKELLEAEDTSPGSHGIGLSSLGLIRAHRGETRSARKLLQDALPIARKNEMIALEIITLWGLALVEEDDGQDEAAARYYLRVLELRDRIDDRHDSLMALTSGSTFFAERGMEKETALCANALAWMASSTGKMEALADLAYALGETALLAGDPKEALRQFQHALSHFEKLEVPMDVAKTELRLGMGLARSGHKEEAARHLNNGYSLARRLGTRPLAAKLAAELEALGQTVGGSRRSDAPERAVHGGLTWRQVEIARLMARGLTNKEIAGSLFLSPRTVDMHVSHILDRLDCRSRIEAVRKATEMGLLED